MMTSIRVALAVIVSAGVLLYCQADAESQPGTAVVSAAATVADGPKVVEDDMHEFMEYVFQPTYRRLKASMASEPADNVGWKAIKSDGLILAESCNLLFARTPEEDGADWNRHAAAACDKGAALYAAARGKDFAAATASYQAMLKNCNACHRQFEEGRHILKP